LMEIALSRPSRRGMRSGGFCIAGAGGAGCAEVVNFGPGLESAATFRTP
jgi:hypothetical protein